MNHIWGWDGFDVDFVYLAALTLSGHDDLSLRPSSLAPRVWDRIQQDWPACRTALRDSLYLVSCFGFRPHSLPEKELLIPVAVYLKTKQPPADFITSLKFAFDRERILQWMIRSQLKGIFSRNPADILLALREIIGRDHETFPIQAIIDHFMRTSGSLTFDDAEREALLDLEYTDPHVFSVLLLLYPDLDFQTTHCVDFIFLRDGFLRGSSDREAAVPREALKIPNLYLREGTLNPGQSDKNFKESLCLTDPDAQERALIMRKHYISDGDLSVTAFSHFFQLRRQLLFEALGQYLKDGYQARQLCASFYDIPADALSGDVALPAAPADAGLTFRRETMARAMRHYLRESLEEEAGAGGAVSSGMHANQSQRPLKSDMNNQKIQALLEILKNSKAPLSISEITIHMRKKGSTSGSYYDLLNSLVEDNLISKQSSLGRHVYVYKGF
jgi:hypothetical protein